MTASPLRRIAPWLMLAACFAQCAVATEDFTLSMQPAWNGNLKPGQVSELGLRLVTSQRTMARVTVQSSGAVVNSSVHTEPGVAEELYIPILHEDAGPMKVELRIDGRLVLTQEVPLRVLPGTTRLAAVVRDLNSLNSQAPWQSDTTITEYVAVSELPRLAQSYDMLAAIWLSGAVLQAIDGSQQQALKEYLAACGLLYVSALTSAQEQALRTYAGCGGGRVINYVPGARIDSPNNDVRPLPGAASLRQLAPAGPGSGFRSLLVFFAAYIALLLFIPRRATASLTVLALPPAATLLALLGWSLGAPETRISSWAETESGDDVARMATLLDVTGVARKQVDIPLPAGFGFPVAIESEPETLQLISRGHNKIDLRLDARLMSRQQFSSTSIVSVPPIEIEAHEGRLRIKNRGTTPTESGTAVWRGKRYLVPGLPAGQEWQPLEQALPWGQSPQDQMLRQRTDDGRSWLLLPLTSPFPELANGDNSTAWILIRGDQDA